ncbi:putative P-loop containing nucleoside triphosphate hydrolase, leucine-rich repeat domain, L [Medicago truncatula]|uniref:LRR and NB-ARC domain disease resistance protein n=1 Tax=Medicago truncatula TaxID=3880 RepID=G7IW70_MEDTR|nr:putative disease resistance RPP13-like protein 1 [Medicago truncatula]XP_024635661.1 putative disease resistance RPP13-like protein 1 [Medicago truncatula]AES69013.2 LRR and NB-ARC domain disease resistance protein [Medicago truncatula]RHN65888.1 putative P-loop containing nucleoside triphosphate hydrolase, leucine-rich repeat domain, L [Medicago truncatula]
MADSLKETLLAISTSLKVLLDKLVEENIRSTKLDVSLLKNFKSTLLKLQVIVNYVEKKRITTTVRHWLDRLRYDAIEIVHLFNEINTEAHVLNVLPIHFKRSYLRKLIEKFEGWSSGEQLGKLGEWNGTPPSLSLLVDESPIQLVSLSASVKVLLNKIVSSQFVDNFHSTKLDVSLLEKLKTILLRVQALYHSDDFLWVQAKLFNDDFKTTRLDFQDDDVILTVLLWLDMLRSAVFEVGYLLEEINPQTLPCKVEAEYQTLTTPSQFSSSFKCFNGVTNSKLQKLIERLQFFSSRAQDQFSGSSSKSVWHQTPTSSIMDDESCIYGRDNDIKKLKHLLLSSDGDDGKIGIISIVGIEGIGKTTLAKVLYNDPDVKDKFELKVWSHVSKDFDDDLHVLETILDNLNINRNETSGVNIIYPKYLLVLDGVCDARSINWTLMMNITNVGETGSRIIITTQDEKVALSIQTFALPMRTFLSVHYLTPLESEDCWSLLAGHAFGEHNDQRQSNLEEIGREVANKCYGSPFAAVALGDILRTKLSPDYWNYVLQSDIRLLIDHDVRPFIQLNYHYLSTLLKNCFAYCSIFPKKSIIEKNLVVQLWIAEGLVESSINQEKVGEEYFDVLVSRSLLHQQSIGNEEQNFEMHTLVHDLATEVSSPHCINMGEHNLHDMIHKLSYNTGTYDSYDKFGQLYGLKDLRTFLALPLEERLPRCLLSNKVVHELLPTMKQLRVLSLTNYKSITEVPKSIGNLLYLRYLNLSHTKIEKLPSETCKLYNLQFLLLSGCKRLTELPEDMGKLVSLRRLDISDTALREMPTQIAKLENLETLSDFLVSKHTGGLMVGELGKYPLLNGKLSISQLQNVNNPFEAVQANMKMKERIDKLVLEWACGSTCSDSQIQSVVLEHLRPSTNLKSLTIKGYGGINFPNWLGDSLFTNMMYLRISNCGDCLWLPPLGQLGNLKELIIEGMQSIQIIGTEFYGSDSSPSFQPFPSLETLHFENMQEWEEWNLIGGMDKFPSLKTLSLSKCPKLRLGNIPDKFPSLTEPELRECPLSVQSIPSLDHVFSQLMMFPLNSLRQLTIDGFPSPMSFPTEGLPKTLKILTISNCVNLEFLPHEYLHKYTSLEELKISYSCNSMISFTLGVLPVLKSLFIEGCKNLKSILIAEDASQKSLSFLKSIKIWIVMNWSHFPQVDCPL